MNAPENRPNGTPDPVPAKPGRPIGGGIPAALLVGAIAVLVVVVSMPRFRAHVLEANREDAQLTIGLLGGAVFQRTLPQGSPLSNSTTSPGDAELQQMMAQGLYGLVEGVERLKHRFRDARRTDTPGELLHHGYRFATGYVLTGLAEENALVAWPNTYGKSGDLAFATIEDGSIYAHPNRGLWSGADPLAPADGGASTPQATDLRSGGSQGLLNVDLSDESWVMIKKPSRVAAQPK